MSDSRAQLLPGYISAVSGATAGLVSGIAVCPLDVVKTRLQVQGLQRDGHPERLTQNVWQTLRHIARTEGLRGLYSGLGPLCVGYLPSWSIYFYVYKSLQRQFMPPQLPAVAHPTSEWPPVPHLGPAVATAVIAGACSTFITNPIWMIKTRMMTQGPHTSWHYSGVMDAIVTIYRVEGVRAFYSGLSPALLGLPHVAIQFPLYERMKRAWAPHKQWYGILLASMASKIVASTITYPHEVIRSRCQIRSEGDKYRGIIRTVRNMWLEEGWRAFYSGLVANVCRAIPSSAVTLMTFELVNAALIKYYLGREALSESPKLEKPRVVEDEYYSIPQNPVIDVESPDGEYD